MNGLIHYPDVDEILVVLLSSVQKVLGDQFVGMYLYGSLSSGDFDPSRSDIDFLVVTRAELPDETIDNLAAMHRQIAGKSSKWANKLEGSYIPRSALRRYDPANSRHPTIGVDWEFGVNPHGSDWIIQRRIIREQGVVLTGPAPKELIDPVSAEEIVRAVREILQGWWSQQLRNPALLKTREYQAFAVLTMCRALYTLRHGEVASKPVSARWALAMIDRRWSPLIGRALVWEEDDGIDDVVETVDFIHFVIDGIN